MSSMMCNVSRRSCILFSCIVLSLLLISSCQGKKEMEYVGTYAAVFDLGELEEEDLGEADGFQIQIGHLVLEGDQTYELLLVKLVTGKWEFKGDHILLIGSGGPSAGRPKSDAMLRIVDSNTLQLVDDGKLSPELLILFIAPDYDE